VIQDTGRRRAILLGERAGKRGKYPEIAEEREKLEAMGSATHQAPSKSTERQGKLLKKRGGKGHISPHRKASASREGDTSFTF